MQALRIAGCLFLPYADARKSTWGRDSEPPCTRSFRCCERFHPEKPSTPQQGRNRSTEDKTLERKGCDRSLLNEEVFRIHVINRDLYESDYHNK